MENLSEKVKKLFCPALSLQGDRDTLCPPWKLLLILCKTAVFFGQYRNKIECVLIAYRFKIFLERISRNRQSLLNYKRGLTQRYGAAHNSV